MIFNYINSVQNEIVHKLAEDTEIRQLLYFNYLQKGSSLPTANEVIDLQLIKTYPVILQDNQTDANFISVHYDNVYIDNSENVFAVSFKISCAVSQDNLILSNGKNRALALSDRVEEILNEWKPLKSTGSLELSAASEVQWNAFITGNTMIFQLAEGKDLNGINI